MITISFPSLRQLHFPHHVVMIILRFINFTSNFFICIYSRIKSSWCHFIPCNYLNYPFFYSSFASFNERRKTSPQTIISSPSVSDFYGRSLKNIQILSSRKKMTKLFVNGGDLSWLRAWTSFYDAITIKSWLFLFVNHHERH